MQFTRNTHVYTCDHYLVGHITHVVLDPNTKKVTHIVVRQGIILTEDKVIPIQMFQSSKPDGAILRADIGDLHSLPAFEVAHYVQVDLPRDGRAIETINGMYIWYPPAQSTPSINDVKKHGQYLIHRPVRRMEQNIPVGEVALREGAAVISADDHSVGHIESILVDQQTDQVTNIMVVKQTLLTTHRWLAPVAWIHSVYEDVVYLEVTTAELQELSEYA